MMRFNNKMRFIPMILILLLVTMMAVPMTTSVVYAAEHKVDLGTASTFGILAGSTITNTGPSSVGGTAGGNIGLNPGTSITGLADMNVSGDVYSGTDPVALQAKNDLSDAYIDAAGRTPGTSISAELGGSILTPGVYNSATSMGLTGTLTLDAEGDPAAVFIFQAGSTLITANGSNIVLTGGAQACNVFWQVGSSATLGTNSTFVGHIMASESITATTGAVIQGQLLALGAAVTLDDNTITNDLCLGLSNGSEADSSNDTDVELSTGELTVTKVVSGDLGDLTLPNFEITVTGPEGFSDTRTFDHEESYTWENLIAGVYTVTESRTGLSSEWRVSGEGTVQVAADQTAMTTITNAYIEDELLTPDQTDLAPIITSDDDIQVLGIVELPRTGDNPFLMILTGLLFFGIGLFLQRKENKTNI